jgi:simple sugar transport system ATP-binding protein
MVIRRMPNNGILLKNEIEDTRNKLIEKYDIRVAEKNGNVSQLSGGKCPEDNCGKRIRLRPKGTHSKPAYPRC